MQIIYSPKFSRQYKKLSEEIRRRAKEKEVIFRIDPADNRLKTHKLNGKLSDFWAFSVDYRIRIMFEFQDQNTVIFHDIDDHDMY
jgi:mRNA-degrading endonuclease YafQ of YafQ-DinJ toxin-antitoxin module